MRYCFLVSSSVFSLVGMPLPSIHGALLLGSPHMAPPLLLLPSHGALPPASPLPFHGAVPPCSSLSTPRSVPPRPSSAAPLSLRAAAMISYPVGCPCSYLPAAPTHNQQEGSIALFVLQQNSSNPGLQKTPLSYSSTTRNISRAFTAQRPVLPCAAGPILFPLLFVSKQQDQFRHLLPACSNQVLLSILFFP
ncbi:hypothetical protein BS78_10G135700 [Paspalum vaginatum]|nr:hypothetical protein BS78_10G135700 [Paspalum vaginatum]